MEQRSCSTEIQVAFTHAADDAPQGSGVRPLLPAVHIHGLQERVCGTEGKTGLNVRVHKGIEQDMRVAAHAGS